MFKLDKGDFYNKLSFFDNLFNVVYFKKKSKDESLLFMFFSVSKTESSFRKDILKLKNNNGILRERLSHIPVDMFYEVEDRIKACNMEQFNHFYFLYEKPREVKNEKTHYILCAHGPKGYLGYKIQDNKLSKLMVISFEHFPTTKKLTLNPLRDSFYTKFDKENISCILYSMIHDQLQQKMKELDCQEKKSFIELIRKELGEEKSKYFENVNFFLIRSELSDFPDVLKKWENLKNKYSKKREQVSKQYENTIKQIEKDIHLDDEISFEGNEKKDENCKDQIHSLPLHGEQIEAAIKEGLITPNAAEIEIYKAINPNPPHYGEMVLKSESGMMISRVKSNPYNHYILTQREEDKKVISQIERKFGLSEIDARLYLAIKKDNKNTEMSHELILKNIKELKKTKS